MPAPLRGLYALILSWLCSYIRFSHGVRSSASRAVSDRRSLSPPRRRDLVAGRLDCRGSAERTRRRSCDCVRRRPRLHERTRPLGSPRGLRDRRGGGTDSSRGRRSGVQAGACTAGLARVRRCRLRRASRSRRDLGRDRRRGRGGGSGPRAGAATSARRPRMARARRACPQGESKHRRVRRASVRRLARRRAVSAFAGLGRSQLDRASAQPACSHREVEGRAGVRIATSLARTRTQISPSVASGASRPRTDRLAVILGGWTDRSEPPASA